MLNQQEGVRGLPGMACPLTSKDCPDMPPTASGVPECDPNRSSFVSVVLAQVGLCQVPIEVILER